VVGQVQQLEREWSRDFGAAMTGIALAVRVEEHHARAGHDRRAEERLCPAIRVIALDHDESRAHAAQRISRCLLRLRKVRSVSGELHGAPQECRGERIFGKDQYIVTTHVNFPARGSEVRCRDRGVGASKRETSWPGGRGRSDP